jgi:hypothetical protein
MNSLAKEKNNRFQNQIGIIFLVDDFGVGSLWAYELILFEQQIKRNFLHKLRCRNSFYVSNSCYQYAKKYALQYNFVFLLLEPFNLLIKLW